MPHLHPRTLPWHRPLALTFADVRPVEIVLLSLGFETFLVCVARVGQKCGKLYSSTHHFLGLGQFLLFSNACRVLLLRTATERS